MRKCATAFAFNRALTSFDRGTAIFADIAVRRHALVLDGVLFSC